MILIAVILVSLGYAIGMLHATILADQSARDMRAKGL